MRVRDIEGEPGGDQGAREQREVPVGVGDVHRLLGVHGERGAEAGQGGRASHDGVLRIFGAGPKNVGSAPAVVLVRNGNIRS